MGTVRRRKYERYRAGMDPEEQSVYEDEDDRRQRSTRPTQWDDAAPPQREECIPTVGLLTPLPILFPY